MAFKHCTKHNTTRYIEIKTQAAEKDLEMMDMKVVDKDVKRPMINMLIYSRNP